MYYVVLVLSAIIWQFFYLGAIGVIFCSSSLLSGIIIAVLLPVNEILAVIFYSERFQAEKGVALVLSLWGFVSYFYGEVKHSKKAKHSTSQTETPQTVNSPCPWFSLARKILHVIYNIYITMNMISILKAPVKMNVLVVTIFSGTNEKQMK